MDNILSIVVAVVLALGGLFLFRRGKKSGSEKIELKKEKLRHEVSKAEIKEAYSRGDTDKLGNILLKRDKSRRK